MLAGGREAPADKFGQVRDAAILADRLMAPEIRLALGHRYTIRSISTRSTRIRLLGASESPEIRIPGSPCHIGSHVSVNSIVFLCWPAMNFVFQQPKNRRPVQQLQAVHLRDIEVVVSAEKRLAERSLYRSGRPDGDWK
jgi:hypothetical protein